MATIIREDLIPSLIENTTMQRIFRDGAHIQYNIAPCEGYVLHDNTLDTYADYDEEGNPIGEPILGYTLMGTTCAASYDFTANSRGFYAVLRTDVEIEDAVL